MNAQYTFQISEELSLSKEAVGAVLDLLEQGASIPFIARYRKEATHEMDEISITEIRDRYASLEELDLRRKTILKSLDTQGKLTDELKQRIHEAQTAGVLEDIYLPYKPKRRTRGGIAREKGLEPLAETLFKQNDVDPILAATPFVNSEKKVSDPDEALSGARDIMAEWINESLEARTAIRHLFEKKAFLKARVIPEKEEEGAKYRDYFDWSEPLRQVASHRMLAIRRAEKEEILKLRIEPAQEEAIALLENLFIKGSGPDAEQVRMAVHDSYKRLLCYSMETEIRLGAKKKADAESISIFSENLRQLLLAPPLGQKSVLAIDPGFRTGCKMVCLDPQGKLLHFEVIFPHTSNSRKQDAEKRVREICREFRIEIIAIGNGTAGRETADFIKGISMDQKLPVIMVNESGASIYSASEAAREEFPNEDITVRGAVSIGRRLMDPLAELVKIDPKSIGVGQYQHDVDQKMLRKTLDDVVISCVNRVGVELNTASRQLLTYVSGLGPRLAQNIVFHRETNGPFHSRKELKKVQGLGPKSFEQSAGFLRIRNASNPLDASAVHPESYGVVEKMAKDMGCSIMDLMKNPGLREKIDIRLYVTDQIGLPTLTDILTELAKPGRDPRQEFQTVQFKDGVDKIEDVVPGMKLPGIVTNITAFGAFVDIGVHQDGLIHVSEMADRFVKDPGEILKVNDKIMVRVKDVDLKRKRIALSLKEQSSNKPSMQGAKQPMKRSGIHDKKQPVRSKKRPFNNPFSKLRER